MVPDPVLLVSKSLDNENPKVGVSEWNLANIGNPPESRDLSSVEKKAVEVLNQEEEKTENSSDSIDNGQINVAMENEGENNERLSDEDSEELEMRQAMEQVEKIIQSTSDLGTDSKVSRSLNFEEVDLFSPKSSNATSCESIQDKEIIPFENVSEEEKETEAFSEDDFRRKSRNTKFLPKKRKVMFVSYLIFFNSCFLFLCKEFALFLNSTDGLSLCPELVFMKLCVLPLNCV